MGYLGKVVAVHNRDHGMKKAKVSSRGDAGYMHYGPYTDEPAEEPAVGIGQRYAPSVDPAPQAVPATRPVPVPGILVENWPMKVKTP